MLVSSASVLRPPGCSAAACSRQGMGSPDASLLAMMQGACLKQCACSVCPLLGSLVPTDTSKQDLVCVELQTATQQSGMQAFRPSSACRAPAPGQHVAAMLLHRTATAALGCLCCTQGCTVRSAYGLRLLVCSCAVSGCCTNYLSQAEPATCMLHQTAASLQPTAALCSSCCSQVLQGS